MTLERIVAGLVERVERRFYGKYRGFVVRNDDPRQLGRLQVSVPSVLGDGVVTGWAAPCVPYGGAADQGFLFVPEVDAGVWVEFEQGDLEFPIWVGTFWTTGQLPEPHATPPTRKIIKTLKGHTVQFEDAEGDELVTIVEAVNGNVITLDSNGITIRTAGTRLVVGPDAIQIGGDAASEPIVLGNQLASQVATLLAALQVHTHATAGLGTPSPPVNATAMKLDVPLSAKHTVE